MGFFYLRSLCLLSAVLSTPRVCFSSDPLWFFRVVSSSCICIRLLVSRSLVNNMHGLRTTGSEDTSLYEKSSVGAQVDTISFPLLSSKDVSDHSPRGVHYAYQQRGSSPFSYWYDYYSPSLQALRQIYFDLLGSPVHPCDLRVAFMSIFFHLIETLPFEIKQAGSSLTTIATFFMTDPFESGTIPMCTYSSAHAVSILPRATIWCVGPGIIFVTATSTPNSFCNVGLSFQLPLLRVPLLILT